MRERRLTKRCTAKIIRIYDIDSIKKEKPSKKVLKPPLVPLLSLIQFTETSFVFRFH